MTVLFGAISRQAAAALSYVWVAPALQAPLEYVNTGKPDTSRIADKAFLYRASDLTNEVRILKHCQNQASITDPVPYL